MITIEELKPDNFGLEQISINLAKLEEAQGNWDRAIEYLELNKKVSPHPEDAQRQIDALRLKLSEKPRPSDSH